VALATLKLFRFSEAKLAIPEAISALSAQPWPERDELIEHLREAAAQIEEVFTEPSPEPELGHAAVERLRDAKENSSAMAAGRDLQATAEEPGWSCVERATFLWDAANNYFTAGSVQAALTLYQASEAAYAAIEHPMAWFARSNFARALLSSGNWLGAKEVLADLLARCPVTKVRINALTSQARLVLIHHSGDEAALADLRDQMLTVWAERDEDPEAMGRMGLMLCQVQLAIDGSGPAGATLARAKALLVSCNSDVLPMAAKIEEELARAVAEEESPSMA
jgi:hypothetical protein